jgi:hypothetical protein
VGSKMKQFADASRGKILSMEHRLSGVLRPIKPRKEFVHGIGQHIRANPGVDFVDRLSNRHFTAVLIAGLISLAIFLALIGRALLALIDKKTTARV